MGVNLDYVRSFFSLIQEECAGLATSHHCSVKFTAVCTAGGRC